MIDFSASEHVVAHKIAQSNRVSGMYINAPQKGIEPIIKSEFTERFPSDKFDFYTVDSLDKLRNDLNATLEKGADAKSADETFVELTKDLKAYLVHGDGKRALYFVGKKVQA